MATLIVAVIYDCGSHPCNYVPRHFFIHLQNVGTLLTLGRYMRIQTKPTSAAVTLTEMQPS